MSFIDPLLVLQEIDTRIWELKKKIASLPKAKAAREADLSVALRRQLEIEGSAEGALDAAKRDAAAAAVASVREELAEIDARLDAANKELAEIKAQRAESVAKVPPAHLRFYERLAISHHPTIVKLEGGVCSGCHLAQPPSAAHTIVRMEQAFLEGKPVGDFVTCGMCGRILYGPLPNPKPETGAKA